MGDDSFNAAAGMAKLAHAAAFVRTNMPFGVRYQDPVLTVQQGLGPRRLYDLEAAAAGPAWSRIEFALAAELTASLRYLGLRGHGPAETVAGDRLAAKLGERSKVQHD